MKQRKIPIRTCTGCGKALPKQELIRVVKSPDGAVSLDLTGKKSGRGAYICRDRDCLKKAQKAKRFERAFEMSIPLEVFEQMEKELADEQ